MKNPDPFSFTFITMTNQEQIEDRPRYFKNRLTTKNSTLMGLENIGPVQN